MDKKRRERYEVTGTERYEALERCKSQIAEWSLSMPDDDPVLRDFGLGDFYDTGEIEFWLCNNLEQGYCSKYIFLFEGQTCPMHLHKIKHEAFFIVKGQICMDLGDSGKSIMNEGEVLEMEVNTNHSFTGHGGPALVLEVSKPSLHKDSYFTNITIGNF